MDNYHALDLHIAGGRDPLRRKVGNNTYAERNDDGSIGITLHATEVLTFRPNGSITLRSGGWRTPTTKDRLHAFTPAGVAVFQEQHAWYVRLGHWGDPGGVTIPFAEGMTLHPDGRGAWRVTYTEQTADAARDANRRRRVERDVHA